MNQIPAHLRAILAGKVHAVSVQQVTPVRDRAPEFTPSQGGSAPRRSASQVIDQCEALEVHEAPSLGDNDTPECYALAQGE
jgi:hypothetical protein